MNLLGSAAMHTFLLTAVYTLFGLLVFALAFWIIVRISPFSIRKEIEDDQNTSLAIRVGWVFRGRAIVSASVIHG